MSTPTRIKNSEFQAGGIYPGGTGIVKDIGYKLWDYNGTRPALSEMCVEMTFAPTDGSNEGKEVIINWNVGPATTFQPDPQHNGFALDMTGTGRRMGDGCTYHQVLEDGFKKNCGMTEDALDGPNGLKALTGSELTLTRMDPPKRNIPTQQPAPGAAPQRVNQVLVPTRAKFAWERGGKGAAAAKGAAAGTGTTTAASNGAGAGNDLAHYIGELLSKNDDYIEMSEFTPKLLEVLTIAGVKGKERVAITKQTKDQAGLEALAAANGWTFDGLVIEADGKMAGNLSR
jgi:hypothetical protein